MSSPETALLATPPSKHVHRDAIDDMRQLLIDHHVTAADFPGLVAAIDATFVLVDKAKLHALAVAFDEATQKYEREGGSCVTTIDIDLAAQQLVLETAIAQSRRRAAVVLLGVGATRPA